MNASRAASGLSMRQRVRVWFMRSESARGYALLSPTLVVVVLGLLFPVLILTTMSFWKQDYVDIIRTFTTENYFVFFEKKIYYLILYRSMRISAVVTLVTIALAYPLAYFIAFHVQKNKIMWIILVTIPFWTSYLLRVFSWKVILGYNGVINSGLISLGVISAPLEFLLYNPAAVVITLAHAWAAVAILPIYVSLEKIDRSLIEAARDLGESAFMTFVRVTLPLSLPGVIAASLLVFIPTVGDYVTPALVGGNPRDHDRQHHSVHVRQGAQLAARGRAVDHLHADGHCRGVRAPRRHPLVQEEGGIGGGCLAPRVNGLGVYAVAYLVFLYLPVAVLPVFSFNDSQYVTFPLKGFTLKWYYQLADSYGLLNALWNSVRVGVSVAVLSTVLGIFAAKAVTRYRMRGRGGLVGFIMVPLVIPEIILGISLLMTFSLGGVKLSLITVGIGHLLFCVPFSMLVLISRMEGFDPSMEEAARDLGENAWGTFWRVTFPIIFPGIVASLLLTFTISFDEFVLAFFLSGTDATLPVLIWSQLRFPEKLPSVLSLGAIIVVASTIVIFAAELIRRSGVQLTPSRV